MAEKATIARPYALAVFELAKAERSFPAWSEMLQLGGAVMRDPQMQSLVGDPRVGKDKLLSLLIDILGQAGNKPGSKLGDTGNNFIKLLIENRRVELLPEIADQYEHLRSEAEGTLNAEVTTAFPLDAQQQTTISAALGERLGRTINLRWTTDNSLLGGVIIRAGDTVIDGSARGQLQKLAGALAR